MMSQVFEKLQDLRNTLKTEILDFSLKLQNCNIQSELPNAIPLEFANDIYEFYPSLKNYPFLILDNKDVFLVYVDEEYREEYINVYRMEKREIKKEDLEMFTVDELYIIHHYLSGLDEENESI